MLKKGITMGARIGGKIKTVSYITACGLALAYSSLIRLDIVGSLHQPLKIAALVVFVLSVLVAVASFFDYLSVYRSSKDTGAESQSDKT
jgi:CDP-diacylglycerol--glycerol-3-phosphate 3-phosphatidyltransferase